MSEHNIQDLSNQNIYLTFTPELFVEQPDHVLVVPIHQGEILFTCHGKRGWELPGGKIEAGEKAEEAAKRETWEETGAKIEKLKQIGQYTVEDGSSHFTKAIYLAKVISLGERPEGFETMDSALFPIGLNPNQPGFSPFMKDIVFKSIQKRLGTEIPLPT